MATGSDAPGLAANGFGDRDVAPILPDAVDQWRPRLQQPRHEPAEARAHAVAPAWVHDTGDASLSSRFLHSAVR